MFAIISAPVYLQYLIHEICDAFGIQEFQSYAEMLQSFKDTQDFMRIIKSNLRDIEKFKWEFASGYTIIFRM